MSDEHDAWLGVFGVNVDEISGRATTSAGTEGGAPNRLQLLGEKQQIEEKLGKMSYPEEDADRSRLENINGQLDDLGSIPTAGPKPQAKAASPPQADNRPTAGEMVAQDKKAALIKRAHDLGYDDGMNGESKNAGTMADWEEVKADPSLLPALQPSYLKGFGEAVPQRQNELVEAHKAYKSTGQIPQTKKPYAWIEIKEGRMMTRAERMDAMLKAQGKPLPTMDMLGNGEVDQEYLTFEEFKQEVLKRAAGEKQQCEEDHTFRGPTNKCKDDVNDKYGGKGFQEYDRAESQKKLVQIQAVADRIEDTKNAGPLKLAGKAIGRSIGYAVAGDEGAEIGDDIGGMVGGAGDILSVKKTADVAKARNANYEKQTVTVITAKGTVELSKTKVAVEQVNAQEWLKEQKAADAKRPAQQRRSDAQLIKAARGKFQVDKSWEPFAPHEREVTVETPRGPVKITVEEYRNRVQEAEKWVAKEKMATKDGRQIKSDEQLNQEAADKYGLDSKWGDIANPNYHGSRVQTAPP
jgi:hypothetical protein